MVHDKNCDCATCWPENSVNRPVAPFEAVESDEDPMNMRGYRESDINPCVNSVPSQPVAESVSLKMVSHVDCGGGASVSMPLGNLEWALRYANPIKHRYTAAEAVATLRYIVRECTQKEQIRRLALMKEASIADDKYEDR